MPRRVAAAEFVISAVRPRDFPNDALPEIALVGRSNVGKSTLINALVRKDIARTSAAPGKTRQANVYRIQPSSGHRFYIVDLPGFGHTGGGEKAREEFAALTGAYFSSRWGDISALSGTPAQKPLKSPARREDAPGPNEGADEEGALESVGPGRTSEEASSTGGVLAGVILAVDARHPGMASDIDALRWASKLGLPFLLVATKVDKLKQSDKARLPRECEGAFGMRALAVSAITGEGLDELWRLMGQWTVKP